MYNPAVWAEEPDDPVEEEAEQEVEEEAEQEEVPPVESKADRKKKAKAEKDGESGKRQMTPIEIGWGLARGYKWAERELEELKKKMDARGVQRPVTCPKNLPVILKFVSYA